MAKGAIIELWMHACRAKSSVSFTNNITLFIRGAIFISCLLCQNKSTLCLYKFHKGEWQTKVYLQNTRFEGKVWSMWSSQFQFVIFYFQRYLCSNENKTARITHVLSRSSNKWLSCINNKHIAGKVQCQYILTSIWTLAFVIAFDPHKVRENSWIWTHDLRTAS